MLNTIKKPFFSVVTPTYNRPHLLQRAMQSVLDQEFEGMEHVVVNDCSSVSYDAVLAQHNSIVYIKSQKSGGVSNARNIGILEAMGEWVVFLDDDDELAPGYLHHLKEYIDAHVNAPAFLWASVKTCQYDESDQVINTHLIDYSEHIGNKQKIFESAMNIGSSYGLAINRQVFAKIGLFDTSYPVAEDTDLVIRLLSAAIEPHFVPVVGVIKHDHLQDRLSQNYNKYSNLKICEKLVLEHKPFFLQYTVFYRGILKWCTQVHYMNHDYISGDKALRKLLSLIPVGKTALKEYKRWMTFRQSTKNNC